MLLVNGYEVRPSLMIHNGLKATVRLAFYDLIKFRITKFNQEASLLFVMLKN